MPPVGKVERMDVLYTKRDADLLSPEEKLIVADEHQMRGDADQGCDQEHECPEQTVQQRNVVKCQQENPEERLTIGSRRSRKGRGK
jgi:hypothetical protein